MTEDTDEIGDITQSGLNTDFDMHVMHYDRATGSYASEYAEAIKTAALQFIDKLPEYDAVGFLSRPNGSLQFKLEASATARSLNLYDIEFLATVMMPTMFKVTITSNDIDIRRIVTVLDFPALFEEVYQPLRHRIDELDNAILDDD